MVQHAVRPAVHPRHIGWLSRAAVSGFLGSIAALIVLLAAYGFAAAVGSTDPRANVFSRSMWNLAHNPATSFVASVHSITAAGLHLAVGLAWAIVYAAWVEPNIAGPGWRKGMIFAIVPCIISLFVFMPIIGVGVLGTAAGAGPFPALGSILLHAVYGLVLGETYALADGEGSVGGVDSTLARAFALTERDMALGLLFGALIGAVLSAILAAVGVASGSGNALTIIAGAAEGAFAGIVVGIFIGFRSS